MQSVDHSIFHGKNTFENTVMFCVQKRVRAPERTEEVKLLYAVRVFTATLYLLFLSRFKPGPIEQETLSFLLFTSFTTLTFLLLLKPAFIFACSIAPSFRL